MPEYINKSVALEQAIKITSESARGGTAGAQITLRKTYDTLCEILQEIKDYESEEDS